HAIEDVQLVIGQDHAVVAGLAGPLDQADELVGALGHLEVHGGVEPAPLVAGPFGGVRAGNQGKYGKSGEQSSSEQGSSSGGQRRILTGRGPNVDMAGVNGRAGPSGRTRWDG